MNRRKIVANSTVLLLLLVLSSILAPTALLADTATAQEMPNGLIFDEDPEPSSPAAKLAVTVDPKSLTGAVTWTKDEVPWYEQRMTNWCWAASLVMHHQWWCPVQLGTAYMQQSDILIHIKGSIVNQGGTVDEIHKMMKEWGLMNSTYESYQFTWKGQGKLFSTAAPTGYADDPKTWLAYVQSPVICGVDTGTDGNANHAVVVIGYDDSLYGGSGGVFVHDPWYSNWWPGHSGEPCYEITMSYAEFNAKWDSYYATGKKRGMIAGVPGDNKFTYINHNKVTLDGTIYDDEKNYVRDVEIGVAGDHSSLAYDSFGEYYREGVYLTLMSSTYGETTTPYSKGTFSFVTPIPPWWYIDFVTHAIPSGSKRTGGYFHIDPKVLGWIQIDVTWRVYDEDDRFHTGPHISVLDDRDGHDTSHSMYEPELYKRTIGPSSKYFKVLDDDATAPSFSDPGWDPSSTLVYDSYTGNIIPTIKITDAGSGLSEVGFSWRYTSTSWSPWATWTGSLGPGTYTFYSTVWRSDWINHVDETLYVKWYAVDNDKDRTNDELTSYSVVYPGPVIRDDDVLGPYLSGANSRYIPGSPDVYRLFQTAIDASGVSTVHFRYKFGAGAWSIWYLYSGQSISTYWYDIPESVYKPHKGETIYWQTRAYDNDADRTGDQAATYSPEYTMYYLSVDTDPLGLDDPKGEGWYDCYDIPEIANVSVSPVSGYAFEYWYLDGASGTPYSYYLATTVTMDKPHRATAKFSAGKCRVTFYTNPVGSGFSITFEGETYSDSEFAIFDYGTSGPATANAPTGWQFDYWETTGNVSVSDRYVNPTDVTINCSGTLKAVFKRTQCGVVFYTDPIGREYYITFRDKKYLDSDKDTFTYGTLDYATAYAPDGWEFDHWETEGNVYVKDPYANPGYVSIRCGGALKAVFREVGGECKVTFYTNPSDIGSITFGEKTYANGQTDTFTYGTEGEAKANAPKGWEFDHWETEGNVYVKDPYVNPTVIAIRCGGALMAVFRQVGKCEVVFYTDPSDVGSIMFAGKTYTNGQTDTFDYGTVGEATAIPSKGWEFDHWEAKYNVQVADPYANPTKVTITCGGALIAVFRRVQCEVVFYTDPSDVGSITFGEKTYVNGQTDTFTYGTEGEAKANAPEGWEFDHWEAKENVAVRDPNANPTLVSIRCGGALIAVFRRVQCEVVFYTSPSDVGSITFGEKTYVNGDKDTFPYGTEGEAKANAPDGWEFDYWKAGGNVYVGDPYANPTNVSIRCGGTLMAVFRQIVGCEVVFYTNPSDVGSITFGEKTYTNDQTDTFDYGTVDNATANPPEGWEFDHWEAKENVYVEDPNANPTLVSIRCGGALIAVFRRVQCEVVFYTSPSDVGSITFGEKTYVNGDKDTFTYGTEGNVSANVPDGWEFDYWKTDGNVYVEDPNANPTYVGIRCGGALVAVFREVVGCEVTFQTSPSDVGSITFGEKTYVNGETDTFPYGTEGIAKANPPEGWVFDHWRSTANVSVSDPYDQVTEITIQCGGILQAVFKRLSEVVIASFDVRPSCFSPNGDGRKDTTTIRALFTARPDVQPTQTAEVDWILRVKTAITVTVRTWTGIDGTVNVKWDGRDDAGDLLPDGEYKIVLQGRDEYGNVVEMQSRLVIIDTVRPTITEVSDGPDPFNPSAGETTTISYTLSEKCHVTINIHNTYTTTVKVLRATQPAGENKLVWDGTAQGLIAADGTYSYEILAVDMAGNEAEVATGTITVES